jgi:hypothetical protein
MIRWKALSVSMLASASLFAALLPRPALAEQLQPTADIGTTGTFARTVMEDVRDESLIEQISKTYKSAKKRAKVKSFKGKCGKYVNHQLVVLGINKKYVGCNGNREFDVYSKKTETTGGYRITAYSHKDYTLKEALEAIAKSDPHARNILVGFEKGFSKAGRRYGHTLFIHGIENGMVYFSDNFTRKIDGKRYREGDPIVCSIDRFVKLYRKCRLDGVIHFS